MRVTNIQYHRIIVVEFILCFFVGVGMTLSVLMYELQFMHGDNFETKENILLLYNAFCSITLVVTMYSRYTLYLEWYKSRSLLTEYDTIRSTGWWKMLALECFLMLMAPYPFLQHLTYSEYNDQFHTTIEYTFNEILLCFGFIRGYVFVRYTLVSSQFMNPRSKRICSMNGCEANQMFAMKAIMKQRPYVTITITLAGTIVFFGY